MYISILDYCRGSVVIIHDTEDVTADMETDDVELVLHALGFRGSEINFMLTKENPYQQVSEYVTLRELSEEADEDTLDDVCRFLNLSAEDLTGKEAHNA